MNVMMTTASRNQQEIEPGAKKLSLEWGIPFVSRHKTSVLGLMEQYQMEDIFVLDHQLNIKWYKKGHEPIKYHPGMSIIRIKRLKIGKHDPMIDFLNIGPTSNLLDCTLGMASDAIVSQFVATSGKVVGLESEKLLALFTKRGLQTYQSEDDDIKQAMRKIEVICSNYEDYLKDSPNDSFDVVYFDPMFRRTVDSSSSIQHMKSRCCNSPLSIESVEHAKRVARKKVILKETSRSREFSRLGFTEIYRSNASFSYGVIDVEVGC
ncbi:hypothetical protein BHU72_08155 [Desulfuribacillus stibiiarsenatis]|uniref:SAM-dependent methyltransferase n=1 Tax=Desulfuribacillus stibiiarsenatis TaxID=1390249 RepID=A0A1E5L3W0_9FIRM|nr:class I SAM-dependent methyltransferase [Desulfuribacillus stibiiarsenatis]OEH84797.1 hypothetical protein BHU72_08155 [Desulfuribacillus stibiiarsenatis]